MTTSLGFRLNVSTSLDGVGFVNPNPLPSFDPSINRLHLLRRSFTFANWNRISQDAGGIDGAGATPNPTHIFSANASENIELKSPGVNYESGFTWAVAVTGLNLTGAVAAEWVSSLITDGYSVSANTGARIEFRSSSADFALNARVFTDAGRADVSVTSLSIPSSNLPFWVFLSWDGDDITVYAPAVMGAPASASIDSGQSGNTAPSDASLYFGRSQNGGTSPDRPTNQEYWAYAQYGRGLSEAELSDEHQKLVAWADDMGVTIL